MTGSGLHFVWAAYGLTAVVLVAYAAGLWIRASRARAREQAAHASAPAPELTHV